MNHNQNILSYIESKLSTMTDIEKTVGLFFMNEGLKEEDLSATNISRKIHATQSALTRFSKKLGYQGYREFIFEYRNSQKYLNEHLKDFKNNLTPNIYFDYEDIIEKTKSLIDEDQLERISKMLSEASRIYLYGTGFSGLVAKEVKIRFVRLGLVTEAIHDLDNLLWTSGIIDDSCLVIGFSLSGKTKIVVNALRNAAKIGAKSILLTTQTQGNDHVDEVVEVASIRNLEQGTRISPQLPLLFMIDFIYAYFLSINKEEKLTLFNQTIVPPDDKK
ncbi:MurR/RpiR family transcriptional regulator [Streptococcus sp. CSL10205-OR2]|uniref:MurR/RpiR family transcriptional regulator n=1 Tax=Streptococcus sp. CSL10205-OR2 TaxID=2980558 RepID=UPI0021DA9E8A|nr:MurR/RpiR family transcriptional regulator [Streptococcus sp. CSL10205-OR2]MCU9533352.1 MurR/RpiR family transcriptional regulator [Streptococcus sp. CSL10205-OR2]